MGFSDLYMLGLSVPCMGRGTSPSRFISQAFLLMFPFNMFGPGIQLLFFLDACQQQSQAIHVILCTNCFRENQVEDKENKQLYRAHTYLCTLHLYRSSIEAAAVKHATVKARCLLMTIVVCMCREHMVCMQYISVVNSGQLNVLL